MQWPLLRNGQAGYSRSETIIWSTPDASTRKTKAPWSECGERPQTKNGPFLIYQRCGFLSIIHALLHTDEPTDGQALHCVSFDMLRRGFVQPLLVRLHLITKHSAEDPPERYSIETSSTFRPSAAKLQPSVLCRSTNEGQSIQPPLQYSPFGCLNASVRVLSDALAESE